MYNQQMRLPQIYITVIQSSKIRRHHQGQTESILCGMAKGNTEDPWMHFKMKAGEGDSTETYIPVCKLT